MAVISGVLKGPMGDALEGVVIELRALRTSATVITQERSSSVTNATGRYSLTVEPGDYSVFISAFGRTPENRGSISVKLNSATGTLNDFLLIPGESDLNPEIVATVDGMRAAAAASAAAAKTSETNAAASANDTVKKSVVTTQGLAGAMTVIDYLGVSAKGAGNANLFLNDPDGTTERAGLWGDADGAVTLRVGKRAHSHTFDKAGFIQSAQGFAAKSAITYDKVPDLANIPFWFRGSDAASFDATGNYSIGTWNSFAVVPTSGADINAANVERGKASFYVDARQGRAYALNGFYVGTDKLAVIKKNDYGIGTVNSSGVLDFTKLSTPAGFYRGIEGQTGAPAGASVMAGTSVSVTGSYTGHIYAGHGATPSTIKLYVGWVRSDGSADWVSAWHSGNTTVDSNGFLKKASPIVKLFGGGQCELNEESRGVTTERVGEGVYRVSGTLGFNSDGAWGGANGGIGLPKDVNDLPLIWVDYEVDEFGDLLIKTFHRVNSTAPKFAQNVKVGYKEGQPIDIPAGRWIDLRVEMPGGDEPEYEPVPDDEEAPEVTSEVTDPEVGEEPAPGEVPAPIEETKE
ncbi:phage tail fiber protein [Serratia fonticola]|uniref:phage tail fiber protein n=1 Tax=Serratia fonticola TaxID=47917 RepID=UPI00040DC968|nr:prophage tail fiber N-terminal domain-containing protein [Serratia fonticola]